MITLNYHEEKHKVIPFSPGWPKFCYPRKDLMTELDSQAPRTNLPRRTASSTQPTIYRDTPFAGRPLTRPLRLPLPTLTLPEEHASNGILIGLAALTLPAVVYSFTQLWSLLAGGSLTHAVRLLLP